MPCPYCGSNDLTPTRDHGDSRYIGQYGRTCKRCDRWCSAEQAEQANATKTSYGPLPCDKGTLSLLFIPFCVIVFSTCWIFHYLGFWWTLLLTPIVIVITVIMKLSELPVALLLVAGIWLWPLGGLALLWKLLLSFTVLCLVMFELDNAP